jgi:hypothetical protein
MRRKIDLYYSILQFLAIWLFGHGVMILMLLTELEAFEVIRLSANAQERMTTESLVKANVTMALANTLGSVIGLAASLLTMRGIKACYFISLLAFCLVMLLGWSTDRGWHALKNVFLAPGSFFNGATYYLINGTLMLLLGILCLWWTRRTFRLRSSNPTTVWPHSA